jgi:hypothetical protein
MIDEKRDLCPLICMDDDFIIKEKTISQEVRRKDLYNNHFINK